MALFETNAVGTQLAGDYFAPLLRKSTGTPRIINVSSGAGSIGIRYDRSHPGASMKVISYRVSKAAQNMIAASQWYELGAEGFKVFTYGPGHTVSNLGLHNKVEYGAKPTSVGSAPIVKMIKGEMDDQDGKYLEYGQEFCSW